MRDEIWWHTNGLLGLFICGDGKYQERAAELFTFDQRGDGYGGHGNGTGSDVSGATDGIMELLNA